MSRILCLAHSGFGKSTGTGKIDEPELDINFKGLNPKETFILSVTSKPLPYPGSHLMWPLAPISDVTSVRGARRAISNDAASITKALGVLLNTPIKNVVIDDFNYIMQDWYMANAKRTGWDAPKEIGMFIGNIFNAIEKFQGIGKNVIVLAHGEDIKQADGRIYTKMKTTGDMVDKYVTPEGKFEVVLVGKSSYDTGKKRAIRQYVTNEDETYLSPKTPLGMFRNELYIPNDLGYVVDKVDAFYNKMYGIDVTQSEEKVKES